MDFIIVVPALMVVGQIIWLIFRIRKSSRAQAEAVQDIIRAEVESLRGSVSDEFISKFKDLLDTPSGLAPFYRKVSGLVEEMKSRSIDPEPLATYVVMRVKNRV